MIYVILILVVVLIAIMIWREMYTLNELAKLWAAIAEQARITETLARSTRELTKTTKELVNRIEQASPRGR